MILPTLRLLLLQFGHLWSILCWNVAVKMFLQPIYIILLCQNQNNQENIRLSAFVILTLKCFQNRWNHLINSSSSSEVDVDVLLQMYHDYTIQSMELYGGLDNQNLHFIIETWRRKYRLWACCDNSQPWTGTMFFFMSLSFFLLALFWNLWIAAGHKSMWIRRLAFFKILCTQAEQCSDTFQLTLQQIIIQMDNLLHTEVFIWNSFVKIYYTVQTPIKSMNLAV